MGFLFGSGRAHPRIGLLCTLPALFLMGCATTQLAEEGEPVQAKAVDIGYGEVDDYKVSGSVSTVYADDPRNGRPTTMTELVGRLPGVQLRGNAGIAVRGHKPVYVLDGMIYKGSITSINVNTVESVTLLKNVGEAAIYGSRVGWGGVLLIKTKQGK